MRPVCSGLQESPVGHAGAHAPRYLRARGRSKTAVPVPSTPRWLESEFLGHMPQDHSGSDAPGGRESRHGSTTTGVWGRNGHGGVPRVRLAPSMPSSSTRRAARQCPRGGRRRRFCAYAIRQFQTARRCPATSRPPSLSARVPIAAARNPIYVAFSLFQLGIAELGQQRVVDRHPHRGSGPHGRRRDPKRGAVLRKEVRCRLRGLQTFRAPLVVERPPKQLCSQCGSRGNTVTLCRTCPLYGCAGA